MTIFQLLDDIRGALTGEEIDESQWDSDSDADTDTDTEARPAVRSTETIPLPESTKNALLIAEEIEWSRDLVWLKWRGTFKHSPLNAYGDEDIDDDDDDNHIQQKDPRKCLVLCSKVEGPVANPLQQGSPK